MPDFLLDFKYCFLKLAKQNDGSRVFGDFVELAAITLRQSIYRDPIEEKRYLDIVKTYKPEHIDLFSKMLAITINALEYKPCDFLGKAFQSLELQGKVMQQYFTPYPISEMIVRANLDKSKIERCIKEKGYLTINDPACGSGGMMIAAMQYFKFLGFNPHTQLLIIVNDISHIAVCMCYVQLTLLGAAAEISRRDTITQENFYTHHTLIFFKENWPRRLRISKMMDFIRESADPPPVTPPLTSQQPICTLPSTDIIVNKTGQLEFYF